MHQSVTFIAYPPEFACYSKFVRKVEKILSNMDSYEIVYIDDDQGFIAKHFLLDPKLKGMKQIMAMEIPNACITHAIIFEDEEYVPELISQFESIEIPIRKISVKITRVVNVDKNESYDVYIGRGSNWGNPYAIGFDGDRDEVIRKYQYDFDRGFFERGDKFKEKLMGKRLGCHCKPATCHGDVLAKYLNSLDDNR